MRERNNCQCIGSVDDKIISVAVKRNSFEIKQEGFPIMRIIMLSGEVVELVAGAIVCHMSCKVNSCRILDDH